MQMMITTTDSRREVFVSLARPGPNRSVEKSSLGLRSAAAPFNTRDRPKVAKNHGPLIVNLELLTVSLRNALRCLSGN
jgi:hypothetical protein